MGLQKNIAGQKIAVYAHDTANDAPKTGDAANITAQLSKDFGAAAATNDANPTELDATDHPGVYVFDTTQAETNADNLILSAVSATDDVVIDPVQVFTVPPNFRELNITAGGIASSQLANGVVHGGTTATLRLGSSTSTPALHVTNSGGTAVTFAATGGNNTGLLVEGSGGGFALIVHNLDGSGGGAKFESIFSAGIDVDSAMGTGFSTQGATGGLAIFGGVTADGTVTGFASEDKQDTIDTVVDVIASAATEARLAELDAANLPADIDALGTFLYTAKVWRNRDGSTDEYNAVWLKNGIEVTSGITFPKIQVIKRDGTDLVEETAMTQVSGGWFKYDEEIAENLQENGETYHVKVFATIDGSERSFPLLYGRNG